VKTLPAFEFIDRFLDHVLPPAMRHKRYYGLMAPKDRQKRLEEIRAMLGCSEAEGEEAAENSDQEGKAVDGDADLVAEEDSDKGYPCPVCKVGRMVRGASTPRPTIFQILTMAFPTEEVIEDCRRRMLLQMEEEPSTVAAPPAPVPCAELRQRLLPLVFM